MKETKSKCVKTADAILITPFPRLEMPSIPGICSTMITIPTPVRKAIMTVSERKSAIKPNLSIPETIKSIPTTKVTISASEI